MRISDWSSDVCSSDLLEARTDKGRQIDLVDHKHVRTGYAGPTLARDLVPRRHVDDIDGDVGQLGTEGSRQIVAAAFDQDQVERRKGAVQLPYRRKVYRSVLADRRVRASAGLDAQYPLGRQRSRPGQEFGILARVDIVGDRRAEIRRAHVCTPV